MRPFSILALAACSALLCPQLSQAGDDPAACHVGAYRLADGRVMDLASSGKGALRWRMFDGTSGLLTPAPMGGWISTLGWTGRPDGVSVVTPDCARGRISFGGVPGTRLAFDVHETTFRGRDVDLVGRLILPKGEGRVPIVVL